MKTTTLAAALLLGVSTMALAEGSGDGMAPLGTNNSGAVITSTNPAVGDTPTATNTPGVNNLPGGMNPASTAAANTPGVNNLPGGMNPDGTAAGLPTHPGPVTDGYNPQGTPLNPAFRR